MRNTNYFKNKKVAIVGLARSGLACANLLFALGADVSVTEAQDNDLARLNRTKLKSKDIKVELGKHSKEFIRDRDLIVISPGVTEAASPVVWAKEFGIPIISEIEVGWILCPATVIAVTGSNGKTTVTTLIGKVLAASGKKAFVCGNIGNPFCAEVDKIKPDDFVSLEVSSFQLEKIEKFKPKISLILNFSCNHLDRHRDMREYLEAKKRIFENQDRADYLILNSEDKIVRELGKEAPANILYFSLKTGLNPNQAAVLAVASILGIKEELCLEVFSRFRGLEHRLELVAEMNNIIFINDSKATTVEAALWALNNISRPIIWIAGGRDKGVDYRAILDLARKRVKNLILIGEAKEKIKAALSDGLVIEDAADLEEAVIKAFQRATGGDCVLLSPMCSSFDSFRDYEERGRVFKNIVYGLVKTKDLR